MGRAFFLAKSTPPWAVFLNNLGSSVICYHNKGRAVFLKLQGLGVGPGSATQRWLFFLKNTNYLKKIFFWIFLLVMPKDYTGRAFFLP